MISNFFSGCCTTDQYDQSDINFNFSNKNSTGVAGIFKNLTKPFKESQVSSYTEKLSIAKKLKQKKVQNFSQNNTNKLLMNDFQRNDQKNSNNNDSTKIQLQEPSLFTNFFNRYEQSEKSLYEELISPRTLIQSQVLDPRQFK